MAHLDYASNNAWKHTSCIL